MELRLIRRWIGNIPGGELPDDERFLIRPSFSDEPDAKSSDDMMLDQTRMTAISNEERETWRSLEEEGEKITKKLCRLLRDLEENDRDEFAICNDPKHQTPDDAYVLWEIEMNRKDIESQIAAIKSRLSDIGLLQNILRT